MDLPTSAFTRFPTNVSFSACTFGEFYSLEHGYRKLLSSTVCQNFSIMRISTNKNIGTVPSNDLSTQVVTSPAGKNEDANTTFSYHWSQQVPEQLPGGSVKILDSRNFPITHLAPISAALVTIKPGAMRLAI
jgi:hypothetical protein